MSDPPRKSHPEVPPERVAELSDLARRIDREEADEIREMGRAIIVRHETGSRLIIAHPQTRIGVLAAESRCRDDLAMIDFFRQTILAQFQAALWMLDDCIRNCPEENWSGPNAIVGKYEVWHIVHHTLSCTDGYLSPDEKSFSPRPQFHPAGEKDIEDEYPSRQFAKEEMLEYVAVVRQKLGEALAAETEESLRGPSGFSWVEINRAELHLYNMRHVMHHTGMISAFLRRLDLPKEAQPRWGFTGWRE